MPKYLYISKSSPGKIIQGSIEAESQQDAVTKLSQMGQFPISLQPQALSLDKAFLRKISRKDILFFTRQLANLVDSGVNIIRGLNIIISETPHQPLKEVLSQVMNRIKDGTPLSESLAAYPYLFSKLYTATLQAGEASGTLGLSLKRLADFLEKDDEFRSSLHSALAYPAFILAVGILTVLAMLVWVIPRLVVMFEDMGQVLPWPTRLLIAGSGFLRSWWWLILALLAVMIFALRRALKSSSGKLLRDKFKLKAKVLGDIVLKTEVSRLTRTLSILLSCGISIVPALDIVNASVGNALLKEELETFKGKIKDGLSFSSCLKGSKFFPLSVSQIVSVAEESGSLEKALLKIADDYQVETERVLKTGLRLLEPIIILGMGLVVGFIVLSLLLPIFQINVVVR